MEVELTVRAVWNGQVIAEADDGDVAMVEGNVYFPPEAVRFEKLIESQSSSRCYWKGKADYFHVVAGDEINIDAAWHYPKPWPLAKRLRNHVAFWRGVRIVRSP